MAETECIKKVDAAINNERVECGECGGLLMIRYMGYNCRNENTEPMPLGEIKCKRHYKGHTCNTINQIQI